MDTATDTPVISPREWSPLADLARALRQGGTLTHRDGVGFFMIRPGEELPTHAPNLFELALLLRLNAGKVPKRPLAFTVKLAPSLLARLATVRYVGESLTAFFLAAGLAECERRAAAIAAELQDEEVRHAA